MRLIHTQYLFYMECKSDLFNILFVFKIYYKKKKEKYILIPRQPKGLTTKAVVLRILRPNVNQHLALWD